MNTSEMREKSVDELNGELLSLLEQQFKLRMQKSTGQLAQTHLLKTTKQGVARVRTVLNEKKLNEKAGS